MSKCADLREQFSAYLDGAVTGAAMQEIAAHLEACSGCAAEFAQWRIAQSLISSIGPAKAPDDLGLRLRVALSQESANTAQEKFARGRVRWQNTLRPLLWQITAGFASTVALLGGVALLIGMFASPEPLLARDEPLGNGLQSPLPLYLASNLPEGLRILINPLVVQAFVNGEGRVYDYVIVSGNTDAKTRSQLEDTLLFSVFAPAQVFGQPVRGTVVLSFSGRFGTGELRNTVASCEDSLSRHIVSAHLVYDRLGCSHGFDPPSCQCIDLERANRRTLCSFTASIPTSNRDNWPRALRSPPLRC